MSSSHCPSHPCKQEYGLFSPSFAFFYLFIWCCFFLGEVGNSVFFYAPQTNESCHLLSEIGISSCQMCPHSPLQCRHPLPALSYLSTHSPTSHTGGGRPTCLVGPNLCKPWLQVGSPAVHARHTGLRVQDSTMHWLCDIGEAP